MKCSWVKAPRNLLPQGKGIMGAWVGLASRAAFRAGHSTYCGYINEVEAGTWAGGVVGLKSILWIKNRQKTLEVMDQLSELGYIDYDLDPVTKKLTYKIRDWVVKCSGAACSEGVVYTTDGYGFLCVPRDITQRLVEQRYTFDEADAWLDLWCHTIYRNPRDVFSQLAPVIQFERIGAALTLDTLGRRWNWEKTKVWRFLQKHGDVFTLQKLSGSFGCIIFNALYPTGEGVTMPTLEKTKRILDEIRFRGRKMYWAGSDREHINHMIAWFSGSISTRQAQPSSITPQEGRVALSTPIIRAYLSQRKNYMSYYDCWSAYKPEPGLQGFQRSTPEQLRDSIVYWFGENG